MSGLRSWVLGGQGRIPRDRKTPKTKAQTRGPNPTLNAKPPNPPTPRVLVAGWRVFGFFFLVAGRLVMGSGFWVLGVGARC